MDETEPTTLGLLAGAGELPLCVARAARRRGRRVAAVAVRGLSPAELGDAGAEVTWVQLGELGKALRALRAAGVSEAVAVGKLEKATLLGDVASLRPDVEALALLARLRERDGSDDSVLGCVAEHLEAEGIRLLPQLDWLADLVAGEGRLAGPEPTPAQRADAEFGVPIALALGALDVGQTVVVKGRAVLALEAIEGTDAAIRRGGAFAAGATVVKLAKPSQDPRFDVPTVGPETLRSMAEAGAAYLVVEAGRSLVVGGAEFAAAADALGIAVLGVRVSARAGELR